MRDTQFLQNALDSFRENIRSKWHLKIFDYWRARLGPDSWPARKAIDPLDFPELLPWINLVDIERAAEAAGKSAFRFRHRLIGTGLVEMAGRDSTGKYFDEIYEKPFLEEQSADYSRVATEEFPMLKQVHYPSDDRKHVIYGRLLLPLTDEEGKLCMVLASIHPDWLD